jgi:hypothetical protein
VCSSQPLPKGRGFLLEKMKGNLAQNELTRMQRLKVVSVDLVAIDER